MAICKFFQSGTCRNGNNCNFEHVRSGNQWGSNAQASKYNESSFKLNLSEERPQWKLSVFGPAKEEPNLIVGTDRSPEEDRYLYYTSMRTTGNNSQYIASHEQLYNQMEAQVNAIINNPSGAFQHYEKEKSKTTGPFGGSAANTPFAPFTGSGGAFGSSSTTPNAFGGTTTVGGFGKPSAFGQTTSAFGGTSAFGQTTSAFGGTSAFGQTSALGSGGSAFGQTSALGSGSAFGQTSALGGNSAFGQTSALGSGSAFGQTSALGSGSAFGKTNALGGSAFGQTSTLGGNSAFGQASTTPAFGSTSALGNNNAFGSSTATPAFGATSSLGNTGTPAFGSTTALGTGGGAFGQTSTLGNNNTSTMETFGSAPLQQSTPGTELEAFQAPVFTYQAIPEVEPPIELR